MVPAQRYHLALCRANWRVGGDAFDVGGEASGGDDGVMCCDVFVFQFEADAATALALYRLHFARRENLYAAAASGFEHRLRQRAVVDGCFLWAEYGRFEIFAERRFQFASIRRAERLGF